MAGLAQPATSAATIVEAVVPMVALTMAALDLESRVKLAANPTTPPRLLANLAEDSAVKVRAAVALNPSGPESADRQLATDVDERVRLLLASKLASALPELSGSAHTVLRERTLAILSGLVRDEAVRIRTAITDCLAAMPNVSRDLILILARDSVVSVSEPVLRLSPMLSAEDLLGLLAAPPHRRTAAAIACRAKIPEEVSEAIAASADSPAIRVLLANESAAIREETLNALIARASVEPEWHAPLVHRPHLPNQAARALAEIVTGQLLHELALRADLSADVIASIRQRLKAHPIWPTTEAYEGSDESMLREARELDARGELNETQFLAALKAGENRRASTLLAVAASVSLDVVDRSASLRSAKALVSLVWKAGFSMQVAIPVQRLLGQIGPALILLPTPAGNFPLGLEEMGWQLDFLDERCR